MFMTVRKKGELELTNSNPFDNKYFLGYINHVNPQFVKVHFPSSTLLSKTFFFGEEFNGGLVGNFVTIEGENHGFIGKISEIDLPEKERLALSDKSFRSSDLHPTAKIEILLSFDYFESNKANNSFNTFPSIGSKVYVCSSSFIQKYVLRFGEKEKSDKTLFLDLGSLTSNKDTKVVVSQQSVFSRHCAVVGTTGGGKSWTISKLLEGISKNRTKAILLDPTGEYSTLSKLDTVESLILGEDIHFSYKNLTIEDLFFLIKPSEKTQAPKLLEAIRSLKCVRVYKENQEDQYNDYIKEFVNTDLLIKSGKNIKNFERFVYLKYKEIETGYLDFDISKLEHQIREECIWANDWENKELFGRINEQDFGYCLSMITRIGNLMKTDLFNSIFNFDNSLTSDSLTDRINSFISSDSTLLRIGFENIGFEFQAREIVANAIGKYLLNKARDKVFKEDPIVLFIDEAHQFLNNSIVDDYFDTKNLSAFDQIAKESRKYGLFLCLATQMPRDIPVGTLSQMGTFLVHRLINYNDKEAVRQACSSANAAILDFLPVLGEGEAILTGVDFSMPLSIKVNPPVIPPDSKTPVFRKMS